MTLGIMSVFPLLWNLYAHSILIQRKVNEIWEAKYVDLILKWFCSLLLDKQNRQLKNPFVGRKTIKNKTV